MRSNGLASIANTSTLQLASDVRWRYFVLQQGYARYLVLSHSRVLCSPALLALYPYLSHLSLSLSLITHLSLYVYISTLHIFFLSCCFSLSFAIDLILSISLTLSLYVYPCLSFGEYISSSNTFFTTLVHFPFSRHLDSISRHVKWSHYLFPFLQGFGPEWGRKFTKKLIKLITKEATYFGTMI